MCGVCVCVCVWCVCVWCVCVYWHGLYYLWCVYVDRVCALCACVRMTGSQYYRARCRFEDALGYRYCLVPLLVGVVAEIKRGSKKCT